VARGRVRDVRRARDTRHVRDMSRMSLPPLVVRFGRSSRSRRLFDGLFVVFGVVEMAG
jgi:hypothetical protein